MDNSLKNKDSEKAVGIGTVDANTVIGINNSMIQRVSRFLIAADNWYLNQIAARNKPFNGSQQRLGRYEPHLTLLKKLLSLTHNSSGSRKTLSTSR